MGKQKNNGSNYKGRPEFKGLKGWEVHYLKQAEKYGHIVGYTTGKTVNKKDNK